MKGLCEICDDRLPRGNSDGVHAQCQPMFCICTTPGLEVEGACSACDRPFYRSLVDRPEVRAAVAGRGWTGPWR